MTASLGSLFYLYTAYLFDANFLMKKSLSLLALVAALSAPAGAQSHFVITPLSGKMMATPDPIVVSLLGTALPAGMVGKPYNFDMGSLLAVTGDPALDLSLADWSAVNSLPPGLNLDNEGMLIGTPTTKSTEGTSFEVVASYKGETGRQVYTIVVNGVALQVAQIAAATNHTCAVTAAGAALCWGRNTEGQLGDGTTTQSSTPVQVSGLSTGVTSLSVSNGHTCAVMTSGAAMCWGRNFYGQLGDGTMTDRYTPVLVNGMSSGVVSIAAGDFHSCALTSTGAAKCWGSNTNGQLGDNTGAQRLTPVTVLGLGAGVAGLTAGNSHSCAWTTSGAAKCWGANLNGQLGDNTTAYKLSPVNVVGLSSGVASLEAGSLHTCAVTTAGAARCWGANSYGRLGDGTTTQRLTPVQVSGLGAGVARVAPGFYHTCAVLTSGAAVCWGRNSEGWLGDGTTTDHYTPVNVVGLSANVSSLSAGDTHACASLATGEALCWGRNAFGTLGDGTTTNSSVPVPVTP